MTTSPQPPRQMDPWSTGTPAYRVALILGMGSTGLGILLVIAGSFITAEDTAATVRTVALVVLGVGLLSHVIGIGLRKRQAAQIIRARKKTEEQ